MINTNLVIKLASDAEYEQLIVKICFEDQYIAFLHQDNGENDVRISFANDLNDINLDQLMEALDKAKKELLNQF